MAAPPPHALQQSCSAPTACSPILHHPTPQVLDEFEGEEYRKEAVAARLLGTPAQRGASSSSEGGEGGAEVDTIVYIWQDSLRGHLYGEWDPQEFR